MKVELFNHVMAMHMSRRKMLQGAAATGLMAAAGSMGADQKELLPAGKQGLKCPCLCDRGLLV